MITNLRLEIAKIKRQKGKKITEMGETALQMLHDGKLEKKGLTPLFEEILEFDKQVVDREGRIEDLEAQAYEEEHSKDEAETPKENTPEEPVTPPTADVPAPEEEKKED